MRQLLSLTFVLVVLSDGDLVRLFRLALRVAGCEEKAAYTDMGYSQSQFSKMMAGLEPPRFLARMHLIENPDVARWFAFLLGLRTGLPREVKRAIPITFAMLASHRMAKASLQSSRRSRETQRYLDQKKAKVS